LPFIDAANGDDIEFRKLKNVLIDAIQIGLDKLKSGNSQGKDNVTTISTTTTSTTTTSTTTTSTTTTSTTTTSTTTTSTTTTMIALNQAKTALEQFQEQV
jgi:hypothetical protein